MSQLDLPFDDPFLGENRALWTPRDIWVRLNQRVLEAFEEDRRLERKAGKKVHFDDLATYFSTFSNTPDGGLIVYGVENKGSIVGCNMISRDQLNKIESCHTELCPMAAPEFKRIPVVINGRQDFCLAIYVPYRGRLVETNKESAVLLRPDQGRS
jgi:ATP-dependent DNA helicase RecG